MGNCLGNNCTRDEPNTIIKIKNNELVINPNSIENPKEISQENK